MLKLVAMIYIFAPFTVLVYQDPSFAMRVVHMFI